MRQELKDIVWHVYGLREDDFDYTVRIVKETIAARRALVDHYAERVRRERPEMADDILDDVFYYSGLESVYLWHFCLWRLQGIFEGIIAQRYLQGAPAGGGLKARLDRMREAGHTIDDGKYEELMDWARLRNALSHLPPEQFGPAMIMEERHSRVHGSRDRRPNCVGEGNRRGRELSVLVHAPDFPRPVRVQSFVLVSGFHLRLCSASWDEA